MPRPWVVLKFGGTSVASAGRWETIAGRVRELLPEHRVWITISALAGVSDALERAAEDAAAGRRSTALAKVRRLHARLAEELGLDTSVLEPMRSRIEEVRSWITGARLTRELPSRLKARIMATGELAATQIGVEALRRYGFEARLVDARDLLISEPSAADSDQTRLLEAQIPVRQDPVAAERAADGADVVLTQGFIARTPEGETCLLGRGGSDTSAALFAALLAASRLEIWSDVHGLFTADPRIAPGARLIRRIGYREAQELAALGAKVLHPRCLRPAELHKIPITLHSTEDPSTEGTRIEATGEDHPTVTAVTCRTGQTLVSISTLAMWQASGFLARTFAPFEELSISVDLVATSQSSVTATIDRLPGGVDGHAFAGLLERLKSVGEVRVIHPCAVVSIVGRRIRAALHELGTAMAAFQEKPVHLMSDSAEDLNLSFVVDEEDARTLVVRLHRHLFAAQGGGPRFGPTWELLAGRLASTEPPASTWWRAERQPLLDCVADGAARFVYHLPTVRNQARALQRGLTGIDRFYYAMKANNHPEVLRTIARAGFGIECVSAAEVLRAREIVGDRVPLLFTPNFCPPSEYAVAFEAGAEVVVDGPEPLQADPAQFRDRTIGVRLDPGRGAGHHEKVRTAGAQAKFGLPIGELARLNEAVRAAGTRVVGLHAHVGSGILDPAVWLDTGRALISVLRCFPQLAWVDLGGGLGVPDGPGAARLDLPGLQAGLGELREGLPGIELRLEPGRFLVSEAGVLVAPVTQVRDKSGVRFAGVATGMNSLLRPALYGAWHGIHNLTRLDADADGYWNVVGPICESADVLGRDRLLPSTEAGDVLLIENAGAYGAVMASRYNLREPAAEVVLGAAAVDL